MVAQLINFMNLLNLKNEYVNYPLFCGCGHIAINIVLASYIRTFCRKLDVAKLENAVLRDPTMHSNNYRKCKIKGSCTIGTSGHFIKQQYSEAISLLPKILRNEDTTISYASKEKCLGEGRFGICYL